MGWVRACGTLLLLAGCSNLSDLTAGGADEAGPADAVAETSGPQDAGEAAVPEAEPPGDARRDAGADADATVGHDAPDADEASTPDAGPPRDATGADVGETGEGGAGADAGDAADAVASGDAVADGGAAPWLESCMGLYGGTVNAIATHPTNASVVFACTGGGLFKTSSAGLTWERLTTGLPSALGCGAVAVGPSNGAGAVIVYAAAVGSSLLAVSAADEGVTWTTVPLPDVFYGGTSSGGTQGLLVADPVTQGTLYVQTASTFVKSSNNGSTWTNISGPLSPVVSLLALPNNLVSLDSTDVSQSTNGGSLWSALPAPSEGVATPQALAYDNTSYFYANDNEGADAGGIYTSAGLQTWALALNQSGLLSILAGPTTPAYGFTASTGYRSGDHGMTWSNFALSTYTARAFALDAQSDLWVGDQGVGMQFSGNQGTTLTARNAGIDAVSPLAIAVDPITPSKVYLAAPDQALFQSANAGMTWTASGIFATATLSAIAIDPVNSNNVYAASPHGGYPTVYVSNDGGATWTPGFPATSSRFNVVAVDPHASTVYAVGAGYIRISTNAGASWTSAAPIAGGVNDNMLAVRPLDGAIFLCTGTGLFLSTNQGGTFSPLSALGNMPVVSVAPAPNDSNVIYAATATAVFQTSTGGATWAQLPTVTSGGMLAMNPLNALELYLATSAGFLHTLDGGQTWVSHSVGLPSALGSVALGVAPSSFGVVYLGVANRGVWKTVTGGQ